MIFAKSPFFSVSVHCINKETERLCHLALMTQWVVDIKLFFVKTAKEKMRELRGGKQTLQCGVHVTSVADVVQTKVFVAPAKGSQYGLINIQCIKENVCNMS